MSGLKKSESVIVTGKVLYARVHEPMENKLKINPDGTHPKEYSLLLVADKENMAVLSKLGVKPKNTDADRLEKGKEAIGDVYTVKTTIPPVVIDAKKNFIPKTTLIGNGTLAKIKLHAYDWTSPVGKKGKSLTLEGIQVLDLVSYSRQNLDGFNEEEGFTATTTGSDSSTTNDDEVPF